MVIVCFLFSLSSVSAHADPKENPRVTFIDQQEIQAQTDGVSGDVDLRMSIFQIHEVKYVTVTAQNIDDRQYYFNKTDNNPADGWSVSWDTSNAPNGEYWIEARTRDVESNEGTANFKLILNNVPKESKIVMDNTTTFVNKSTTIYASLVDVDSNPLRDKDVSFIIDGEKYSAKTTSNGVATIVFTPKEVKDYDVIVKFDGDNRALSTQTVTVIKSYLNVNTTVVSINDTIGNNKEKIILKANLVSPGIYTHVNKTIEFYVNGKLVGSNLTDEKGNAVLYYTIQEVGGNYIWEARYQTYSDSASLFVPEAEIYVSMNAITYSKDGIFTKGNNFKLTFVINNDGPSAAENVVLKYKLPTALKYISSSSACGDVVFNSSTSELVWKLDSLAVGSQNMEVMFNVLETGKISLTPNVSTDTYVDPTNNVTQTKFLTVTGYKLVTNSLTKYYTASNKYRVYLYTADGKVVPGANIKITIGKQSIVLKTNSKGYVEVSVDLKPGKHTVKVTCNGLSASRYITIKPLIVSSDVTKKKAKVIKYSAKFIDNKGKVLKYKYVTFKVNGKTYKVKTNSKGYATASIKNLKVGNHVVYTSYGKSTMKNTIKVKR